MFSDHMFYICFCHFEGRTISRAGCSDGEVLYTSGPNNKATFFGRQNDEPINSTAQRNEIRQLVSVRL